MSTPVRADTDVAVVAAAGISKRFGAVRALTGADLVVAAGEVLGLVGHNGAGKSTLMNILAGVIDRDEGGLALGGQDVGAHLSTRRAYGAGVRCIFQELALCPNLDAAENTRLVHASLSGLRWRGRAERVIAVSLDAIFPGHGIDLTRRLGDLPIADRQMVEVARAFSVTDTPPRLVILDEPTSALDERRTGQLLDHVRRSAAAGISAILITHRLHEIFAVSSRIVVMRDGAIVADRPTAATGMPDLVALMGGVEESAGKAGREDRGARPLVVAVPATGRGAVPMEARQGEIIGLAGLDGHGQREALRALTRPRATAGRTAYVAGDRQTDGVFPFWSITRNLSFSALGSLKSGGLVSRKAETQLAETWRKRIGIRAGDLDSPLLTLSGGNQQKVLFARALACDADVILLDDPMRGVDIATKQEVYRLIRQEADGGRTFVWYSTELEELTHCDRVYVFREGSAVVALPAAELTTARIVEASFAGGAHG